ncbi:MAG: NAD(P)H-dependent glycerol-3-phosphate dehydrogenase [Clostridia bacterium]|nr:NAD(P)H-dependent glycerol-3-phosphate dehydrogenase [Clostridia bacterium]
MTFPTLKEKKLKITVIGCGRWGSLIAWYLSSLGHQITLYGRASSARMQSFLKDRKNDLLTLPDSIALSTDLSCAAESEILVISVGAQNLRELLEELSPLQLHEKTVVLCMKGIEIATGKRLSEIAGEYLAPANRIAVWLGPGHVQEFYAGIPNCMVIDSDDSAAKSFLIEAFSGPLIRFYYGNDLIGNEIGGAAKNVIGIAAGMLDGLGLSSLKGALTARGTREISRLIKALGGNELTAYGLCHLGDYGATVFSPYSHNRRFGEAYIKKEPFDQLAEGYYTVQALLRLAQQHRSELPICETVYRILFDNAEPQEALEQLFTRDLKTEF